MVTSLAQKLQLKAAQRLRVLNAPPEYVERLERDLPGINVAAGGTGTEDIADAVLLFVNSLAEAQRLAPDAIGAVQFNGLLWMAYPKGTSKVKTDVNRDRLWEAIKPLGWLAIRQIAVDEVWSALRFRPAELVGKPHKRGYGRVAPMSVVPCTGCGALVPAGDGATHPYIGASPGCWAIYGEVLAKEYGEYQYPAVHRLTVDAYAAQHPGAPSRRSIQSVAVHLISLHLILEHCLASEQATGAIRDALRHREQFVWLDPPDSMGLVTILDVRAARDVTKHEHLVWAWARSVWEAWSPRHGAIRNWASLSVSRQSSPIHDRPV